MKKAVIAVLFFSAVASAQSPLGFSYPLGVPDYSVTGASAAMGGSGIAVIDEAMGIALNPANAAMGDRATFSALVSFDLTNISDDGLSSSVSGYAPKMLSLTVPIGRAGSLGFSMQNRYDANLNFYSKNEQPENADGLSVVNTIELNRSGGLTAWQAGWAYRFANDLGIGIAYERLLFNRESRISFRSEFEYASGTAFSSTFTETESMEFYADGIRFGAQIPVHEKVTLGAAAEVTFYRDGNGEATTVYNRRDTNPLSSINDTLDAGGELSVSFPPSINIGAAYKLDERWLFVADAKITMWGSYKSSHDDVRVNREAYGISVGARFVPGANILSTPYWERIAYSSGLRYGTLPSPESGAHEFGAAIGVGLPIPNDGGVIDIVLDYGRRTDARFDKYAENVFRFMLGINGGRSWYQRETKDY